MRGLSASLVIFFICCFPGLSATPDTLASIKSGKVLRVGVKADLPPWGFRNEKGELIGMEIEMAQDVAKRLGVKLELIPVTSSNRMQYLQDRKIDLMIATMSITPDRKKTVGVIDPYYYATIIGVLVEKSKQLNKPEDLEKRPICAVEGAYLNKAVSDKFVKASLIEYKTATEVENALLEGKCDGFAFDDVVLIYMMRSNPEKWKNFDLLLLLDVTPAYWGIAVRSEDREAAWGQFMSKTVKEWHRKDVLLHLEKKWVGDNSMALKWLTGKVKSARN